MRFSRRKTEIALLLGPALLLAATGAVLRSRENANAVLPDGPVIVKADWASPHEAPGAQRLDIWVGWKGAHPSWWGRNNTGAHLWNPHWRLLDGSGQSVRPSSEAGGYFDEARNVYRSGCHLYRHEVTSLPVILDTQVAITDIHGSTFRVLARMPVKLKVEADGRVAMLKSGNAEELKD